MKYNFLNILSPNSFLDSSTINGCVNKANGTYWDLTLPFDEVVFPLESNKIIVFSINCLFFSDASPNTFKSSLK